MFLQPQMLPAVRQEVCDPLVLAGLLGVKVLNVALIVKTSKTPTSFADPKCWTNRWIARPIIILCYQN